VNRDAAANLAPDPLIDFNALPLSAVFDALVDSAALARVLEAARIEDLGARGDVTSRAIIPDRERAAATIVAREEGVACGLEAAVRLPGAWRLDLRVEPATRDGKRIAPDDILARVAGDRRDLLAAERAMLNIVGRLSGVATVTRAFVDEVKGTRAVICDTRKTTPGLRLLEKYAVRCGGGTLHRIGLFDAALFKDNHLSGIPLDRLTAALNDAAAKARDAGPLRFVEVEVDSLDQLDRVLDCKPGLIDIVLLDNMELDGLKEAVRRRDARRSAVQLEASGGVSLDTVRAIALTGVERISSGSLTHGATWLDVAMDVET